MKFLADMGISPTVINLPSVVVFRLRNMRFERVNRHLLGVISQHAKELEDGAIVVVSEGQARIPSLPLKNDR